MATSERTDAERGELLLLVHQYTANKLLTDDFLDAMEAVFIQQALDRAMAGTPVAFEIVGKIS